MKYRIGDRLQDKDPGYGDIWEITGIHKSTYEDSYNIVCIKPDEGGAYKIGQINTSLFNSSYWTYLGNFSKQDSFEQLYNLLNE